MEVWRFKDEQEYKEWLKYQSGHVKDKAKLYEQRYPNTIPIILEFTVDECQACWGDEPSHVFVPPFLSDLLDKFLKYIIAD